MGASKIAASEMAHVWLFACVSALVDLQVPGHCALKVAALEFADVRLFFCAMVCFQFIVFFEGQAKDDSFYLFSVGPRISCRGFLFGTDP